MSQPASQSAEELERLGDTALAAGQLEQALDHYKQAHLLIFDAFPAALVESTELDAISTITDDLNRVGGKLRDLRRELQPPPKSNDEQAAELRAAVDTCMESGDLAGASHVSFRLGQTLERLDDQEGAESAFRHAVALAREVDASDPELLLAAFTFLIHFLSPSEESVALAQEMAHNLIERRNMYHPMRAADAAYHWAVVELNFAEVAQHRVDHAIDGITRQAIGMLTEVCSHGSVQALQRLVGEVLRGVGRGAEADQWQAEADKYEDWSDFMDQEIPGHVHLWDVRFDLPDHQQSEPDGKRT